MRPAPDPPGGWEPLLSGPEAAEALEVARELARLLAEQRDERPDAPEQALRALLFAYCDEAFSGEGFGDLADELLEAAVESAHRRPLPPALHGGLLTVAWVVDHLGAGERDDGSDLDDALLEALAVERWQGDYDLVSGLVGIGLYAVGRLPRPGAAAILARGVLRFRRPGRGLGGFCTYLPDRAGRRGPWVDDPSFLTGVAGVALGLLAAGTNIPPAWDLLLGLGWS